MKEVSIPYRYGIAVWSEAGGTYVKVSRDVSIPYRYGIAVPPENETVSVYGATGVNSL